jgi:hypothetical protein
LRPNRSSRPCRGTEIPPAGRTTLPRSNRASGPHGTADGRKTNILVIKARKLTQARAAKLLGVSQSRVSDLVRGKWEKFSLEMLITLATRAGIQVHIKTAA